MLKTFSLLRCLVLAPVVSVFSKIKRTASEFNVRGDLAAGANIAAFVKIAEAMNAHGAV